MHKYHKNSIANRENKQVGSTYEQQFQQTGLQQLFPGAKYIGKFNNSIIGSEVEHVFEHNDVVYVADCKGGDGLMRRDTILDVVAESLEFMEWKTLTSPKQPHRFIIITTNLTPKTQTVSINRIQLAKKYGLHDIYLWKPQDKTNTLDAFFYG